MNIVDSTSSSLNMSIKVYLRFTDVSQWFYTTFYATYQHAQSTVTLAQSKSYSFSSSGLGGVLKFSSTTISDKYDKMQGISYSML